MGKFILRALLILVALAVAVLGWDVWQLRMLRPPDDRTLDGFLRDGRRGNLLIDSDGQRLYWTTWPRTVIRTPQPATYEFARSGQLLNWTPGDSNGMMVDVPVRHRGKEASVDEARAWLRPAK